jgi:hypothetical protein
MGTHLLVKLLIQLLDKLMKLSRNMDRNQFTRISYRCFLVLMWVLYICSGVCSFSGHQLADNLVMGFDDVATLWELLSGVVTGTESNDLLNSKLIIGVGWNPPSITLSTPIIWRYPRSAAFRLLSSTGTTHRLSKRTLISGFPSVRHRYDLPTYPG